jgi:hypothetical protein
MLLALPTPEFRDSLKKIWKKYVHIKKRLIRQSNYNKNTKVRLEKLEREFLDLYERTKTKEEKLGEETRNKAKGLFYHVDLPDKSSQNIFRGLG